MASRRVSLESLLQGRVVTKVCRTRIYLESFQAWGEGQLWSSPSAVGSLCRPRSGWRCWWCSWWRSHLDAWDWRLDMPSFPIPIAFDAFAVLIAFLVWSGEKTRARLLRILWLFVWLFLIPCSWCAWQWRCTTRWSCWRGLSPKSHTSPWTWKPHCPWSGVDNWVALWA